MPEVVPKKALRTAILSLAWMLSASAVVQSPNVRHRASATLRGYFGDLRPEAIC